MMHPLRLTLWGDFAKVKSTYLSQHLTTEHILLPSRVQIIDYQGILTIKLIYFSFIKFV